MMRALSSVGLEQFIAFSISRRLFIFSPLEGIFCSHDNQIDLNGWQIDKRQPDNNSPSLEYR